MPGYLPYPCWWPCRFAPHASIRSLPLPIHPLALRFAGKRQHCHKLSRLNMGWSKSGHEFGGRPPCITPSCAKATSNGFISQKLARASWRPFGTMLAPGGKLALRQIWDGGDFPSFPLVCVTCFVRRYIVSANRYARRTPLDLGVSPRATPGCEQCYDMALMDRYPADEFCDEASADWRARERNRESIQGDQSTEEISSPLKRVLLGY